MAVDTGRGVRADSQRWGHARRGRKVRERAVEVLLAACAYLSVLTTFGIVLVLLFETLQFFQKVSIVEFLTSTTWTAAFPGPTAEYGIWALVSGTVVTTVVASIVALPIGLGAAIYLSEYSPTRLRSWLKPALEVLAGVPTIVFGFFALTFVTPLLQKFIPGIQGFNALSPGLVMGIMIIPTVASVSEDSIYAVPRALREGAYALGATKREVATRIVVPAALSGIVASFILGISRAVGETMIVTVAGGSYAHFSFDPRESIQTMTAFIVQVARGETSRGSITYDTIFAVGMALFVLTLILNIISYVFVRRYRESYE